jgi:hypothetical protein
LATVVPPIAGCSIFLLYDEMSLKAFNAPTSSLPCFRNHLTPASDGCSDPFGYWMHWGASVCMLFVMIIFLKKLNNSFVPRIFHLLPLSVNKQLS